MNKNKTKSGMMKQYIFFAVIMLQAVCLKAQQDTVYNSDVYLGKIDITANSRVRLQPGFRAVAGSDVKVYIDPAAPPYEAINPVITPESALNNTVSPNGTMNYIRTTFMREQETLETSLGSRKRMESVEYYDGLGRLVQSINVQGTPDNNDIVQALSYDQFGREKIRYLPYANANNTGAYTAEPNLACETFYSNAPAGREAAASPWNEILYEASPLNRVTGGKGPDDWQNKPTAIEYLTNTNTVANWTASGTPATYAASNFVANQLYVTQYTDEDGNQTREYKDKLGRVVCKASNDGTNWLETHYIYDDFGLLRCVAPPKATGPADTELCYYYEYDARKRMTMKDLPGAEPVYMVYDKRDRLVMTQDGNLRAQGKWQFIKYDALNRPVMTGIFNISKTQPQAAGDFANDTGALFESRGAEVFGYTKTSFPDSYDSLIDESKINTVTWYDDYNFTGDAAYDFATYPLAGFTVPQSSKTKGLATGTLVRVIENASDVITDNLLLSVSYYDDFGRPIRVIVDNHMGEKDVIYTNYNFVGEITETTTIHNHGQSNQVKLAATYSYDHQGRLLAEKLKINDENEITLAGYKYNDLGELTAKYLHDNTGNDFNQEINYSYNVKGWLRKKNDITNIDNDLFAQELKYQDPTDNSSYFNGNIWQTDWLNTGEIAKNYTFGYDEINRLEAAVYSDGIANGHFNTAYTYDANGNINTLSRKKENNEIDALTYSYISGGNRLESVTDARTTEGYHAVLGNYGYDVNGNMVTDPSKGTTIEYNYLNLPKNVEFGANDNLRYTYDAAGNKLVKKVDGTVAGNNTRLDYSGNFLYENNELKAIFTSAGRIVPFNNNGEVLYKFEYNLKDHLGNTRVVFSGHSNGQPEVMQVTDYYPFGLVMNQQDYFANGVLANKYLYNNKELQDDELAGNSLGWYDYGARMYDPELGRWHIVDPMAEKYDNLSPYNYVANNPITFIDPRGDTISISDAFQNDEQMMTWYTTWKSTEAGTKFHEMFGIGGSFEHVSVNFAMGDGGLESGSSGTYIVDRTGSSKPEKLKDGINYGQLGQDIALGKPKNKYLKSIITMNRIANNKPYDIADGALTINHETQHLRQDLFTLYDKIPNRTANEQHILMKDSKSVYYQERYNTYFELKSLWFNTYKSGVFKNLKDEHHFIHYHINSFRDR